MAPTNLRARARRAYECGRLFRASGWAAVALPRIGLGLLSGEPPLSAGMVGLALASTAVACEFASRKYRSALFAGLGAGVPSLLLRFAKCSGGHFPMGGAEPPYETVCGVFGALGGVLIGLRAANQADGRWAFAAVAVLVAGLAGSLCCAFAETAGVFGMLAGLMAGAVSGFLGADVRRA